MKKRVFASFFMAMVLVSWVSFSFAKQEKVKNVWENFNPGTWVLYELNGGMQQKQTLVDQNDKEVTVKIEIIMNNQVLSAQETKIPLEVDVTTSGNQDSGTKLYNEDISVKNKTITAAVSETRTSQGLIKSYMSDEIPGSMIQSSVDGNIMMKLIDYEIN